MFTWCEACQDMDIRILSRGPRAYGKYSNALGPRLKTLILNKVTRKQKVHNIVDKPFIGTNEYKGVVTDCNNVWQGHW